MVVLELNRKLHVFIGVCSQDFSNPKIDMMQLFKAFLFCGWMVAILLIGSGSYLFLHFSDLATSTNAAIVVMGGFSGLGCYYSFSSSSKNLKLVYSYFQDINDAATRLHEFDGYKRAEQKSRTLTIWLLALVLGLFFISGIGMPLIILSIELYHGNSNTLSWFLPYYYHNVFPFDETTVSGFFVEFILQIIAGHAYVLSIASTCTFFGGSSYYIEACCLEIKHLFRLLDDQVDNSRNPRILEMKLNEIITFHNKLIRLVVYPLKLFVF